jgi:hypothetical protein
VDNGFHQKRRRERVVAKKPKTHVLKTLELTTLLVALDHLEEYGPGMAVADPYEKPGECVYLKYIGDAQLKALTDRLPHIRVRFSLPGRGRGNTTRNPVRVVFSKPAIIHVLQFSFPRSKAYVAFVRDLKSVDESYWKVVDAKGKPVKRPSKDEDKG